MLNIKPGSICAFYGRVSSKKQDISNQASAIQSFVEKYKCTIAGEYLDEAVSAFKRKLTDRINLIRLLNDIPKKQYEYILIYERSRVARNALEHAELRTFFKHANIPVIIVSSESYYDSKDQFVDIIKDATTRLEVALTSNRTTDTHESKTVNGELLGGIANFGYCYKNKKFVLNPQEALLVKQVFDLYKKGEGFDSIAKNMKEKSYRDGKNWQDHHVKAIVTNPLYTGKAIMHLRKKYARASINDRSLWVMGESPNIPQIISEKDWEYCYQLYLLRRNGLLNPKEYTTSFLFNNLIYCKSCNKPLKTKDQQTTDKNSGKQYGAKVYLCDCGFKVVANEAHNYVLYYVINKMIVDGVYGSSKKIHDELIKGNSHDIEQLNEEIQSLQTKIQENELKLKKIKVKMDEIRQQSQKQKYEIISIKRKLNEQDDQKDLNDDLITQLDSRYKELEGILRVFQGYLLDTDYENRQIAKLIIERADRIDFINNVLSNFSIWDELFKHLVRIEISDNFSLRRLLLILIDRVDAQRDPLDASKIFFDIRAKVNLETDNYVEIDFTANPEHYPELPFDEEYEPVSQN